MALATLSIDLVAKLATLERDMGKAAHIAERNAAKMEAAFSKVGQSLAAIGASLSVGAFASMIKGVADTGDELAKMSTRTGIAVEELSKLQYAASLSDVSNGDLASSLGRLNKVLGEAADGSKEATDALARFGIAPGSMDALEAFKQISDRVKNTADQTKIASAMNDVFGKSWATLVPMIKSGSSGLQEAGDELERMGGVMSGDLAKSSEAFNDNITRLNTQLQALKMETLGPLIPLLEEITKAMSDSSDKTNQLSESGSALKTVFETVAVLGANVGYVFKQTGAEIGGLAAQLTALGKGDFQLAGNIGDVMKEDAAAARKEIDSLSEKLLSTSKKIQEVTAFAGRSRVTSFGEEISSPVADKQKGSKGRGAADTVKELTVSTKDYQAAIESLNSALNRAQSETLGLDQAQETLHNLMQSPEWGTYSEAMKWSAIEQASFASGALSAADAQSRLNALMADTPTAQLEKAQQDMTLLAEAFKRGEINAEQFNEAASARLGLSDEIDKNTDKLTEQKSGAEELGMSFSSAFEDAIVKGEDFSKVLEGIGEDILRIMVRKNITEPLAGAVSGFDFSSLFSANADGGVYNSPSLSAYSGGVYSSPKLFKFASGAGVFGEAGPEAIMPLKRGADGKLGVAGGASNVTVNVIEAPGSKSAGTTQTTQGDNGEQVITVFVEKIKNALIQDVGSGGSFASKLEGQYALNRAAGAWR